MGVEWLLSRHRRARIPATFVSVSRLPTPIWPPTLVFDSLIYHILTPFSLSYSTAMRRCGALHVVLVETSRSLQFSCKQNNSKINLNHFEYYLFGILSVIFRSVHVYSRVAGSQNYLLVVRQLFAIFGIRHRYAFVNKATKWWISDSKWSELMQSVCRLTSPNISRYAVRHLGTFGDIYKTAKLLQFKVAIIFTIRKTTTLNALEKKVIFFCLLLCSDVSLDRKWCSIIVWKPV